MGDNIDKVKRIVRESEADLDSINRHIEQIREEAEKAEIHPESMMYSDGTYQLAPLLDTKARLAQTLLESYVWLEKEESSRAVQESLDSLFDQNVLRPPSELIWVKPLPERVVITQRFKHGPEEWFDAKLKLGNAQKWEVRKNSMGDDEIVAHITDLRREINGHLTGLVDWTEKDYTKEGWEFGIVMSEVDWELFSNDRKGISKLLSATLTGIYISPIAGIPSGLSAR